ncbi:hypothetical protein AHAS_Ahas19G0099900 [Arachis hypogaea]
MSRVFLQDTVLCITFVWRSYERLIIPNELHGHLEVCDTVAPLLSFEYVEWHPVNQVTRQFEYAKPTPDLAKVILPEEHCITLDRVQLHD